MSIVRVSLSFGLCEPLVSSVGLSTWRCRIISGFMSVWDCGWWFLQRFLFLKHLTVSITKKAGRAVKIVWALDSNADAVLDIV